MDLADTFGFSGQLIGGQSVGVAGDFSLQGSFAMADRHFQICIPQLCCREDSGFDLICQGLVAAPACAAGEAQQDDQTDSPQHS
jgi:hypothetical protein